jgi:integrase
LLPRFSTYLGHRSPVSTYWYLSAAPELRALAANRLEHAQEAPMSLLAPTLQLFFRERLANQRQASPPTIVSYRNTFRRLLRFVPDRTGKAPSALDWADLDIEVISAFLDYLETGRHNSARSRNTRLAAVRSLFRFAALRHPEHA